MPKRISTIGWTSTKDIIEASSLETLGLSRLTKAIILDKHRQVIKLVHSLYCED